MTLYRIQEGGGLGCVLLVLLSFLTPAFTCATAPSKSPRAIVSAPVIVQISAAHLTPKGKGKVETALCVTGCLSGCPVLDAADSLEPSAVRARAFQQRQCGPSRAPPSDSAV